jgi:hypothetical protein
MRAIVQVLEVCGLVSLIWLLCYKSVKTSGVLCSVKISNSVIITCNYDLKISNKSNHQSEPLL